MPPDEMNRSPSLVSQEIERLLAMTKDGLLPMPEGNTLPAAAGSALRSSEFDAAAFLKAFRRRWLLASSMGVLFAVIGGVAGWYLVSPPKYTARTLLHVEAIPPAVAFQIGENRADFFTYQRTQMALIKTRLVLTAALHDPEVRDLQCVVNQLDPVQWLEKEIQVDFKIAPEILSLSMSGDGPEELTALVNAVKRAYLQEIVHKDSQRRQQRLNTLKEISARYEETLRRKRQRIRDMAEVVGSGDSQVLAIKQRFAQEQLALEEKELLQGRADLRKLEVELAVLRAKENKRPDAAVSDSELEKYVEKDPAARELIQTKAKLEKQVLDATRAYALGARHPTVQRYKTDLGVVDAQLEARRAELRALLARQLSSNTVARLQAERELLQERRQLLQTLNDQLTKDIDRLRKESRSLNKGSLDIETDKQEIAQIEQVATTIANQVETLKVELAAPARVTELEDVVVSRLSNRKRQLVGSSGGAIFSLGLALAGVSWWEYRRRRVNSLDEVAEALGLKPKCNLPALPDRLPPRGFRPFPDFGRQMILADAVDDPRTALLQAARAHAIRVIMVTSAVSGEGKTSLASQLAASLSRIGKTVLVDGDLKKPGLAQLFELPPGKKGLSELLRGEAELAEVVQETPTGQLHVIDAGRYSSEASQIPEEGLPKVLELLRDQYAFIVLDSSPVLPAAEVLSLGKYVDGVVLSMLRDVSRLSQVHAAYQRLAMLGIRILGAVINGTRAPADGWDWRSGMPSEGSDTRAPADGWDWRSGMPSEGSDTR